MSSKFPLRMVVRATVLALVAGAPLGWGLAAGAAAASSAVYAYPIPGSHVASPGTQIAFRDVPARQLLGASISVSGSRSGVHSGHVALDSDGRGGSFISDQPFAAGEVVTVETSMNIAGAANGSFQFTVASPAGAIGSAHWPAAARTRDDVWRYRSRPDLTPPAVTVDKRSRGAGGGFIFLAPQFGPQQDGPMILDSSGRLVWFSPLSGNDSASDFRVQRYHRRPVLTWWQGYVNAGVGTGEDEIYDSSYRHIAEVRAANGLNADLHEFEITPQGTALIIAAYPVYWDASSVHASAREIVLDSVVQEIDIPTGLVLFQWDSLDHVPVTDTYERLPSSSRFPFDYFHANAVEPDRDGSLLISARNTWAVYKVDHHTGAVIWRLGGRHSSFRLARGLSWAFQHDVRVHAANDRVITLFDNGAGPPRIRGQSRALRLLLNLKRMSARRASLHLHVPSLLAANEGSFQQLPGGRDFIGWGQQPYFSEYDRRGRLVLDGRFVDQNSNYRAYRLNWSGTPATRPSVGTSRRGGTAFVFASWNGATHVRSWRVYGGGAPGSMRRRSTVRKTGFETAIKIRTQRYVAVQALDWSGHVMATSVAVAMR